MDLSKLLLLVLCQISTHSCALFNCDFSNRCHPYESSWWKFHADICFRCPTRKRYHCARDYDSPYVFKEGCAVEKTCSAGEEPHLSYKENGKAVTEPVVYCVTCYDPNYYNRKTRLSSEYSECPHKKWNDCSKEKHKILCKPDDSTDERFCRCDAKNGYSPVNDFSYETCSYKDYDCRDYNKCPDLPSGKKQQLLLNYTCAPVCDEGFGRQDEDSDICQPIPKSRTTRKTSTKQELTSTTVAPTKAPVPTTTPKFGGSNTEIIGAVVGGLLVFIIISIIAFCIFYKSGRGQDCRRKFWPYSATLSLKIKFTSLQFTEEIRNAGQDFGRLAITKELETALEKLFSSLRGCIQVRIVGFQSGSLMVEFYIFTDGKSTEKEIVQLLRKMFINGNLSGHIVSTVEFRGTKDFIEIIVPPRQQPNESTVNTEVDDQQPNGRHADRQSSSLRAPLSEPEDVSTPNLSSGARKSSQPIIYHKTTKIYHGPVFKSKGGNTQIALGGDSPKSRNKNVKITYNKQDVKEGEDQLLLQDEVTETKFIREGSESISSLEDSKQQNVPVESHTVDELNRTADITCKQHSPTEDCKDCSGVSTGTGDDGATGANPTSELTNVEADSEGKLSIKARSLIEACSSSPESNNCACDSTDNIPLEQGTSLGNELEKDGHSSSQPGTGQTLSQNAPVSLRLGTNSVENGHNYLEPGTIICNIGEKQDFTNYADREFKDDTPTAKLIRKAYRALPENSDCYHIRRIRGDNYCGIRSTVYQILVNRLPPSNIWASKGETLKHLKEVYSNSTSESVIHEWNFANRISYNKKNRLEIMQRCLSTLYEKMEEMTQHSSYNEREHYLVNLLNSDDDCDLDLMEGVKLLMLLSALRLDNDIEQRNDVPEFAQLLFARDGSKTVTMFVKNHLRDIGDSGGLEQVEMCLLGYSLGVLIRVFRLYKFKEKDFISYYPDRYKGTDSWPVVSLITEDDRHYNVAVL